jgi:hypothetical protein
LNTANTYTPYTEVGYITVDGRGHITGGFDDYFGSTSPTTGNYSIINNGTGTVNLNISTSTGVQQLTWGITLANPGGTGQVGSFAVIEGDPFANASGTAYVQDSTTLATAPSGTFVFRTHVLPPGISLTGSQASVGLITFNPATSAVTGSDDFNNAGTVGTPTNFAGTFTAPSAGIGTASFTDGLGAHTFDYFVINANTLILYETDATNGGFALGRAEMQSSPGAYTNASFSGSYVFGSRGDTAAGGAVSVNSVGQLAADGAGNITGGTFDWVRDGSAQLGVAVGSGTYTLDLSGRVTIQNLSASPVPNIGLVLYLVSPSRAFILVNNDTTRVEDGTMDLQTGGSFSNSSFSGQYAVVMGGLVSAMPLDRTGTTHSDGNGNLDWSEFVNSGGTVNSVCLTGGTYTVDTNGRVLATVPSLSGNLVFYLISNSGGYVLQGDAGTQMFGGMVNQSQPVPVIPGGF